MKYLFLAIFILSGTIHLYASNRSAKKLRAQTKWIILLALLGWYVCCSEKCSFLVIAAILTSWLGDVLLIFPGTKWFVAGGISFMASHVCFSLAYLTQIDFAAVPVWAIVLTALVYTTLVVLVFRGLRPYLKKALYYPMFFYLLINGTMNSFALFRLISMPGFAAVLSFIGAVLFFISDSTLFYVRFSKSTVFKTHFLVMLTYIIAEFMIVEGLILAGM